MLAATAVVAAATCGITSCVTATTGPNRIIAEHAGWGIVAEVGEDGHLDALFLRAPQGVHFTGDGAQFLLHTGPSAQGRDSIRIIRIPPPDPDMQP